MAERSKKTKILGLLFVILISVLAGCGSVSEFISEKTGTPSNALETTEAETVMPSLKDKSEFLASHLLEGHDDLYDMSDYVKYGEYNIINWGFRTETEIMLIYRKKSESQDDYCVRGLDIMTGEVKDYPWTWSVGEDEFDYIPYVAPVSYNPLVLYCSANGTVFCPENEEKELHVDKDLYSDLVVMDGAFYLIGNKRNIDKLSPDGKIENIYTAPEVCEWIYSERGEWGDYIKLSASDRDGDTIYIELDPVAKGVRYYIQERDDSSYVAGACDGWVYSVVYKDDNISDTFRVTDMKSGLQRQIVLGDEITGEAYLSLGIRAVSDTCILFGIEDFEEAPKKLLIWDFSNAEVEKADIKEKVPYEIKEITKEELRERADEIKQKYNVIVKYGEEIQTYTSGYRFEVCKNKSVINQALTTLDESFSLYPDGFFKTLSERYDEPIVFTLTGTMVPRSKKTSISSSSGLQSSEDGAMVIYLDIGNNTLYRDTVVHEVSHMIDQRLIMDDYLDEDAWNSLNPPEFEYYYTYVSDDGVDYSWGDGSEENRKYTTTYDGAWEDGYKDTYFIDTYAKTWPTEDRARLFEYLLSYDDENYNEAFKSEHLQEKLDYYFKLIREDLATDSWPEETSWEKKLNYYKSY